MSVNSIYFRTIKDLADALGVKPHAESGFIAPMCILESGFTHNRRYTLQIATVGPFSEIAEAGADHDLLVMLNVEELSQTAREEISETMLFGAFFCSPKRVLMTHFGWELEEAFLCELQGHPMGQYQTRYDAANQLCSFLCHAVRLVVTRRENEIFDVLEAFQREHGFDPFSKDDFARAEDERYQRRQKERKPVLQ